jgi:hypothetical protein
MNESDQKSISRRDPIAAMIFLWEGVPPYLDGLSLVEQRTLGEEYGREARLGRLRNRTGEVSNDW